MANILNAAISPDEDVFRSDAHIECGAQMPITVENSRLGDVELLLILATSTESLNLTLIAITATSEPSLSKACWKCGICWRQGTHHVAENFKYTAFLP